MVNYFWKDIKNPDFYLPKLFMEFPRNYDDMDTPHLFVKALSLVIFIYVIFINLRRSIYNPQPKK